MKRFCVGCRRERPIRDFDLGAGPLSATCRFCAEELARSTDARSTDQRAREQIAALENRRRSLIAALVKIDAEIAALRTPLQSSSFKRVDPADVLDSSDGFSD